MMAPGLPEIASKFGITSPTIVGLTLSIFLVSFAIGVRGIYNFILNLSDRLTIASHRCASIGNVWSNLGEHLLAYQAILF